MQFYADIGLHKTAYFCIDFPVSDQANIIGIIYKQDLTFLKTFFHLLIKEKTDKNLQNLLCTVSAKSCMLEVHICPRQNMNFSTINLNQID